MWPRMVMQKGKLVALKLEDRKHLALSIIRGNDVQVYGYFTNAERAQDFFRDLAEILETQKGE